MIRRDDLQGKAIKFVANDGFTVNCFGNGDIYEDVNNYCCIPNFHNMDATGVYAKDEYTMEVIG